MENENELLDVNDVAKMLKTKPTTIYNWVYRRKIVFIKIGTLLRFRKEDIINLIAKSTVNIGF